MSGLRVLIAGASVAGPAAAYFFSKLGASVTVIERYPSFRGGGQNIDIRSVGVSVMRRIPGMENSVRAKTTTMDGMTLCRHDGGEWGTIRATGNPDEQSLISEYEIFRDDLATILYDMTKANNNVQYVFDEQIKTITQSNAIEDGPVTVEFTNKHLPTAEYDLIVACDGATSRTRAIGFNCHHRDNVYSTNSWAAYFSVNHDFLEGATVGKGYNSPGGRLVAVGPDPKGTNRAAFLRMTSKRDSAAAKSTEQFREAQRAGVKSLKEFVKGQFLDNGWKTADILADLDDARDFYASEVVQVRMPALSIGRFVLVGDAGYAPGYTGTGTSLALAGAYVLAGEIGKHQGDVRAGLQGYERTMRPLIDELQHIPFFVPSIFAPQTRWGVWIQNRIFMVIAATHILEYLQKFFANAFSAVEKDKLPKYECLDV